MKTTDLTRLAIQLSLVTATPVALAQGGMTETPKTVQTALDGKSLTDVVSDSTTFSTLKKALKATDLDVTLADKGAYTLFAPTDEAFEKLPKGTLTKLLLPENKEKLRSLLLYHVIAGKILATDLKNGEVKTMNGEKVKIDIGSGKITIDGEKVFSADVIANNGVMHSIGTVLVPKSLEGFVDLKKCEITTTQKTPKKLTLGVFLKYSV
jgi:uncharacterized surface protein with fasciclin (FAS1) repeats